MIIPVGQVFGSRNAPSYYCILADIRQALASSRPDDLPTNFCDLVTECVISVDELSPLTTVPMDSHHPSLTIDELRRMYNASFVDDNALTAFLKRTRQALQHSVPSAFEVFGRGDTRRGDCLEKDKPNFGICKSKLTKRPIIFDNTSVF